MKVYNILFMARYRFIKLAKGGGEATVCVWCRGRESEREGETLRHTKGRPGVAGFIYDSV